MGNSVFPTLPGLKWSQAKTPIFSTIIQKATSGRSSSASFYVYPLWHFGLSYELLRDSNASNELKEIMGFYLQRAGAYDSFLYIDGSDSNIANQTIGTGNNVGKNFQMIRTLGGYVEPRYDIIQPVGNNYPLTVYLNGNAQNANNYTVSYLANGTLSFNVAPANGANIAASFSFYYRVRFGEYGEDSDESFVQFMRNLWELKQVDLYSVR